MHPQFDFGYPWWLSYGHLVIAAPAALLWLFGRARKWSKTLLLLVGAVTVWSVVAFFVTRFGLNANGRLSLPTQKFLSSGSGTVLDMGAGTGRSTLMVLEERPQTTVTALDLFGDSYEKHFGPGNSGQERLTRNLQAAGLADRATIQTGDMRKLPFEPGRFDAVVSTYAIDHLSGKGIDTALRETARVLKPRGEFLIMNIAKDMWLRFTFGPLLLHSGTRDEAWWTNRLRASGFEIIEAGKRPVTLFILSRKL